MISSASVKPADAMVRGKPERFVLRIVPPSTQAEHESPTRNCVQRRGHVRNHARTSERATENERSQLHARGHGGDSAEQRPCVVHPVDGPVRHPRQKVVGDPHRVEPCRLGRLGDGADIVPSRRAAAWPVHVADRQHDARFHVATLRTWARDGDEPARRAERRAGKSHISYGPTRRKKMLPGSPCGWPKNAPKSFPADASPS